MDLFKLIFLHDQRLDELKERQLNRSVQEVSVSIEDFMKPDPTYSKFYISGTRLANSDSDHQFGLNRLSNYSRVSQALAGALSDYKIIYQDKWIQFEQFTEQAEIGIPAIFTLNEQYNWDLESLKIDSDSNIGHRKSELAEVLEHDDLVLYKEPALQGFDLHLFSKENIYPKLFYPLQELLCDDFRFFSMNGKRIQSERKFYFETWALDNPPHGAEEVFRDTKI